VRRLKTNADRGADARSIYDEISSLEVVAWHEKYE